MLVISYYIRACQCGVPVLTRRSRGVHSTCGCVWLTTLPMLTSRAMFVGVHWEKVHVGPEGAASEFHWRARRNVCVGSESAALTRVAVLLVAVTTGYYHHCSY